MTEQPRGYVHLDWDPQPFARAHIEGLADPFVQSPGSSEWRRELAWARARTPWVVIRFGGDTTWWVGEGASPSPHYPGLDERVLGPIDAAVDALLEQERRFDEERVAWAAHRRALKQRADAQQPPAGAGDGPASRTADSAPPEWQPPPELQEAARSEQTMRQFVWPVDRPLSADVVRSVTVGCKEPHRLAGWWGALTNCERRHSRGSGEVAIGPPGENRVRLIFSRDHKLSALTFHVLHADPPAAAEAMAELGGRTVERDRGGVVLEDPEGNRAIVRFQ